MESVHDVASDAASGCHGYALSVSPSAHGRKVESSAFGRPSWLGFLCRARAAASDCPRRFDVGFERLFWRGKVLFAEVDLVGASSEASLTGSAWAEPSRSSVVVVTVVWP
jgi:hypothetical protein